MSTQQSPPQGYNIPVGNRDNILNTKLSPETVIGEVLNTPINKDTNVFSPALTPTGLLAGEQHDFSILICVEEEDKEPKMSVTFNGTDFCQVNAQEEGKLRKDSLFLFVFPVKFGDSFNIQFNEDTIITILRVGERQC